MADRLSNNAPPQVKNPETRYLAAYLHEKFPDGNYTQNFPIGPAPPFDDPYMSAEAKLRAGRAWRLEADAVRIFEGVILVVEAKLRSPRDGIADLILYREAALLGPELAPYQSWEVRIRLVFPRELSYVAPLAAALRVEIDYWSNADSDAYFEYYQLYWTREYREQRDAVLAARRAVGL